MQGNIDGADSGACMKHGEIVLGGGCFWCSEAIFSRLKGVAKVTSGYAGGKTANPAYEQVCTGKTGHAEVIKIEYDPTTKDRQGNDIGSQYRSAIFCTTAGQKRAAEAMAKKISAELGKPIVTEIKKLENFYPAEEYHSQYYEKNRLQPYCALVIPPKLHKLKEKFGLL
jgi:peptide-methionine (S)-S-oxide reductase